MFRLSVWGVGLGVAASLALGRFLAHLLYGVKPADPATILAVSLLLMGVSFVAGYLPARRASRVEPIAALHHE